MSSRYRWCVRSSVAVRVLSLSSASCPLPGFRGVQIPVAASSAPAVEVITRGGLVGAAGTGLLSHAYHSNICLPNALLLLSPQAPAPVVQV